jgi:predicted metallopeptidase
MPIKYFYDQELQEIAEDISRKLFPHVDIARIKCFRSTGSSTKRTIARCHAMGKLMQLTVGVGAHYALEFLNEKFNRLSKEDQVKTVIHELMHIPKTFGGGFRHHDHVTDKNVDKMYKEYLRLRELE